MTPPVPAQTDPTVGLAVVSLLSRRCNLQCHYCNVDAGPHVRDRLDPRLFEAWLSALAELGHIHLAVQLHGGEPLMASPTVEVHAEIARNAVARWPTARLATIGLVTNGILLDRDRAASLRAAGLEVIVSVDGPQRIHDRSRVNAGGRGSHREAMRAVTVLRDLDIVPKLLSVVSTPGDVTDAFDFFRAEGLSHVKINPVRPEGRARPHDDPAVGPMTSSDHPAAMADAYLEIARMSARHNRASPDHAIHEDNVVAIMSKVVGGAATSATWTLLIDDHGSLWAHPGGYGTAHMRLTWGQVPTAALLADVLHLEATAVDRPVRPGRADRLTARQLETMRPCAGCPGPLWCTRFRPVVAPVDGGPVDPDCEWRRQLAIRLRAYWDAAPDEAAWVLPARVEMATDEARASLSTRGVRP